MTHPDDPFVTRFARTSKEAFGTNFYEEKPSSELVAGLLGALAVAVFAVLLVYLRF